jgi:hypothetical protein
MLFSGAVNDNNCRLGMDTMCQGPGFLTESFCENSSPILPISLVFKDPAVSKMPTVLTGNGAIGLAGFDCVLGENWLRHRAVVLEMGTRSIII